MGFHDALADKAYESGHRPEHFKAAAQRHANAFWVYLGIAGVVWWFASWQWALIPAALAVWTAWQSASATMIFVRLELIEKMLGKRTSD
jgi:hypothetical protein